MYVASEHKLQKFSTGGHLIRCVGQYGSKDEEFRKPRSVGLHHGHVNVCDCVNNHLQVFDTDLNFIRTIGSPGSGRGQFKWPYDLDFDIEGKAYISDKNNHQSQVLIPVASLYDSLAKKRERRNWKVQLLFMSWDSLCTCHIRVNIVLLCIRPQVICHLIWKP